MHRPHIGIIGLPQTKRYTLTGRDRPELLQDIEFTPLPHSIPDASFPYIPYGLQTVHNTRASKVIRNMVKDTSRQKQLKKFHESRRTRIQESIRTECAKTNTAILLKKMKKAKKKALLLQKQEEVGIETAIYKATSSVNIDQDDTINLSPTSPKDPTFQEIHEYRDKLVLHTMQKMSEPPSKELKRNTLLRQLRK